MPWGTLCHCCLQSSIDYWNSTAKSGPMLLKSLSNLLNGVTNVINRLEFQCSKFLTWTLSNWVPQVTPSLSQSASQESHRPAIVTHPSTPSKTARQRTREILVLASSTGPLKGESGSRDDSWESRNIKDYQGYYQGLSRILSRILMILQVRGQNGPGETSQWTQKFIRICSILEKSEPVKT